MTFSTSVLENAYNIPIKKLIISLILIAFVFITIIFLLLSFIEKINSNRDDVKCKNYKGLIIYFVSITLLIVLFILCNCHIDTSGATDTITNTATQSIVK